MQLHCKYTHFCTRLNSLPDGCEQWIRQSPGLVFARGADRGTVWYGEYQSQGHYRCVSGCIPMCCEFFGQALQYLDLFQRACAPVITLDNEDRMT